MKQTILTLLLIFMPLMANADASGYCGDNLTWTYEEATKTLTITGEGAMTDYEERRTLVWIQRRDCKRNIGIRGYNHWLLCFQWLQRPYLRHDSQQREKHRRICFLELQRPDFHHDWQQCDEYRKLCFLWLQRPDLHHDSLQRDEHRRRCFRFLQRPDLRHNSQ